MILPMPATLPSPISFLAPLLPKSKFYDCNKLFVVLLIPFYAFTCVLMPELTYFLSSLSLTSLLFNYYSSNHIIWKPFLTNLPTHTLHTYTQFSVFFFSPTLSWLYLDHAFIVAVTILIICFLYCQCVVSYNSTL